MAASAHAQKIYWTDSTHQGDFGTIRRANLDGSEREILVEKAVDCPVGIAVDRAAQSVFWADCGTIRVAELDGTNARKLIHVEGYAFGLALDLLQRRVYWTAGPERHPGAGVGGIQSAKLDGSDIRTIIAGVPGGSSDIALDATAGKIYWTSPNESPRVIRRANLDGSDKEVIVETGFSALEALALDPAGGKLYWASSYPGGVSRSNLDGSEPETIASPGFDTTSYPNGLAHDPIADRIYWSTGRRLLRMDADGGNFEELPVAATRVAVDSGEIFATSIPDETVFVTDLNGNHKRNLSSSAFRFPNGIALSITEGRMYWADSGLYGSTANGGVLRSRLDGSEVETLVSGPFTVGSVAIDSAEGKLYWTQDRHGNDARIRRANLDGSGVVDLVVVSPVGPRDLILPRGIALDPAGDRMYWTDIGTNKVMRARRDGTEREILATTVSLGDAERIALDMKAGKAYWTEGDGVIPNQYARLAGMSVDGGAVETVVSTYLVQPATFPMGLALDTEHEYLYWSDIYARKIQRIDLLMGEAGNIVEIVGELHGPYGLALDLRVPGDCTTDGATTRIDVPEFVECIAGSEIDVPSGCFCADATGDWRVDLVDFAAFQRVFQPGP